MKKSDGKKTALRKHLGDKNGSSLMTSPIIRPQHRTASIDVIDQKPKKEGKLGHLRGVEQSRASVVGAGGPQFESSTRYSFSREFNPANIEAVTSSQNLSLFAKSEAV